MPTLKLLVWNMEWMNDLFGPNDQPAAFKPDDAEPAHSKGTTVRKRRNDLAGALNELAPDIVVVVEGPNRASELQLFFDTDVHGQWKAEVQPTKGQTQNVGVAARTDQGKFDATPIKFFDTNNLEAFGQFTADVDDDGVDEIYKFERRPLYVEVNPLGGRKFRLFGLHLKSKGIFDAYEWSRWWQVADANRRKLLAQATQLRLKFLDPYLKQPETKNIPLIVCGDINDGPGLDASEKRLFGSAIERLMGSIWKPELCLHNALFDMLSEKDKAELDFSKIITTSFKDPIFEGVWQREWIDHILYSTNAESGWVNGAMVNSKLPDGKAIWQKYPHASDHYPISAAVTV